MAITAESVVVEVVGRLDKAEAGVKKLDATFTTSTNRMQQAARTLDANLDRVATSSTSSFTKVEASSRRAADSLERDAGRIGNAQRNIGRQFSDIGAQLAGGQSPFLIAAQQAPQLADALADTGGKAAAVASFFAGPWGAAILAAGSILGTALVPRLFDASDASATMSKEQIDLARFVDVATGAINRQTVAVQRLAAAQARQKDIEAGTRTYTQARGGAIGAIREAGGQRQPTFVAGVRVPDTPSRDPIRTRLRELADEAVRTRRPINDLVLDVRKLVGDRPEYRELVKSITSQGAAAVEAAQGVERLKAEQRVLTGTATAADRALLGMGQATADLVGKQVALATATTAVEKARARLALVEERGRNIQAGDAQALAQYRTDLTKATQAVQSAEAAERAATTSKRAGAKASRDAAREARTAAREREQSTRNAARAERELAGLQSELAGAKSNVTADRAMQDEFARQRINLERDGRLDESDERRRRGELSEAELAERRKLINAIADAQLQYVERTAAIRQAADEVELARARSDASREILDAQAALATTAAERRDIELQLLDLAVEERRLAAQRVVDLARRGLVSAQEGAVAQTTLDNLPRVRELGRERIERDNQGPLADYKDRVQGTAQDMSRALEGVAANGLQSLEDGLVGIISGTESAGDAFKRMAASIIADLARVLVQALIVKAVTAAIGGGSGGIAGAIGTLFGFADGGRVGPFNTPGYGGGGFELPRFASGGAISGPGGPRSDSVLARLSNGEFVVNAAATRRFLPVLEAINSGRLASFADGGAVGRAPRAAVPTFTPAIAAARSGGGARHFHISVDARNSVTPQGFSEQLSQVILAQAAKMDQGVNVRTRADVMKDAQHSRRYGSRRQ